MYEVQGHSCKLHVAVNMQDRLDGKFVSTYKSWRNGAVSAGIGWERWPELWDLTWLDFPATQLSRQGDYTFLQTAPSTDFPDGKFAWVHTIDIKQIRRQHA